MLIEYEQLLYYKGFMERCQYIFKSRGWGGAYGAVGIAVGIAVGSGRLLIY